jgi:hypothetical protein
MNNESLFERIPVRSFREIDALVGSRITHEKPLTRWEDSRTEIFFASVEEALDSLHDPHFSQFINDTPGASAVITEIKEYRRYTRDLDAAWSIIDQRGPGLGALTIRRDSKSWIATFGEAYGVEAPTAPLAICAAALLACGILLECEAELSGQIRIRR